jgi:thiol-disulfide isomerase/thioredoxin
MTPVRKGAVIVLTLLSGLLSAHAAGGKEGSVRSIDLAGVKRLVAEHHGEILVINLWATWCAPCVAEMPDLISLSRNDHLNIVGISIDDQEDVASKVTPMVQRLAIPYPVYVKAAGNDEAFINGLNSGWTGAVPATFIYDGAGKQRTMLVGKQTAASLRKAVEAVRGR